MLAGSMVGNEVHQQLDIPAVRLGQQAIEVGERSIHRVDREIVGHVVAEIDHRRAVNRRKPNRVDTQMAKIIELGDHAGQIADAIAIGIEKRAHVHLI